MLSSINICLASKSSTLAGLITGLPLLIDALIQAYNAGAFTNKSGSQLLLAIGLVTIGWLASDKKKEVK